VSDAKHVIEEYEAERRDVINALRQLCADFGDNDWPDNLHLGDVIEKHLAPYLYESETK